MNADDAPRCGWERAYIALGSNLGDREAHLVAAREAMAHIPDTRIIAVSEIEETTPLGGLDQRPYLNQMALVETQLAPRELLQACRAIEEAAGRIRTERWGPRTLDLDLVRFGNRTIEDPDLVIPHPGLPHREFWQRELTELRDYDR
ncbi:MAG: 2-amino-4-hydroxy-6-hydroxymethyldihydropteridine diphosphokinase [Gemmatimonadales bacterium]|nr:2-amino-4-hydroxy-6-hydroxymethyldihydropteridine diphosphokinase [Gemmatimonadales bacterium]